MKKIICVAISFLMPMFGLSELAGQKDLLARLHDSSQQTMKEEEFTFLFEQLPIPDDAVLKAIFGEGHRTAKQAAIVSLQKSPESVQREVMVRLLGMDAVWVPAIVAKNPALVANVAETGTAPMLYGGSETGMDHEVFMTTSRTILTNLGVRGLEKTGTLSKRARAAIADTLQVNSGHAESEHAVKSVGETQHELVGTSQTPSTPSSVTLKSTSHFSSSSDSFSWIVGGFVISVILLVAFRKKRIG